MRSIALLRAVLMIHARGLSGTPAGPPMIDRGRKGFLRRLFGQVEVADEPDQRRDDTAPIGAVEVVDGGGGVGGHVRRVCDLRAATNSAGVSTRMP